MHADVIDKFEFFHRKKLLHFIDKCKNTLSLDQHQLQHMLHISPANYHLFQNGKRDLDIAQLSHFLYSLDLTIQGYVNNKIDFDVLKQHSKGHSDSISEKYLIGAYSKKIAAINILKYVEQNYNTLLKQQAMQYLQVTEHFEDDPYGAINVNLIQDLFAMLREYGLSDQDIFNIGLYSVQNNPNNNWKRAYQSCKHPHLLYEYFFEEVVKIVDKNNIYKFQVVTPTYCIVNSFDNEELVDLFHTKQIGGMERCLYRAGILSATTNYLGLPLAKVTELKCVHRGDDYCSYLVDYRNAKSHSHARNCN